MSKDGIAKVLDYGISLAASGSNLKANSVRGKPGYIPPEYASTGVVDPRGDVFQLGIVLHEMLTGSRLFAADGMSAANHAILSRDVEPPSALRPEIPKELDDIVLAACNRNLAERTVSADIMRTYLVSYLRSRGNPDSEDVAAWLRGHFPDTLAKRRRGESRARAASQSIGDELPTQDVESQAPHVMTTGSTVEAKGQVPSPSSSPLKPAPRRRNCRTLFARSIAAVSLFLVGLGVFLTSRSATKTEPPALNQVSKANSQLPHDDAQVAKEEIEEVTSQLPAVEPEGHKPLAPTPKPLRPNHGISRRLFWRARRRRRARSANRRRRIARGLRKLSSGSPLEIRATSWSQLLERFRQRESVDVIGASGELDFDPNTEEASGLIETWIIENGTVVAVDTSE